MLLGEQLPDDRPFKVSVGIKGINDYFDSMAPNKDYRYTDSQFYEYKLKDMTQQKIAEANWRVQGDTTTNPDDLDGYARAIAYAQEYKRSKEAKSSPPSVQSSPERNTINTAAGGGGGGGGSARKPNINLIQALNEASESNSSSSRRNSGEINDLMNDMIGKIEIQSARRSSKNENIVDPKDAAVRSMQKVHNKANDFHNSRDTLEKKGFLQWKEQTQKHKDQFPDYKKSESIKQDKAKINVTIDTPSKKKDKKKDETIPEPPKKPASTTTLSLFTSPASQSFTSQQKMDAITNALTGLKNEFKNGGDTIIGAENARKFDKYHLTVSGNSKWSTAKKLLETQFSRVEELITKGGRNTVMDDIFQPVLAGKKNQGQTKIASNVLFDDKVNSMGFEAPTPNPSRASSKVSDATKKTVKN
jgi:hypothetical protein